MIARLGDHPTVVLLNAVTEAIYTYPSDRWPDSNTSEAYGQILEGIVRLLNEDLGGLDGGSLWDEVYQLADTVSWDLDASTVRWEQ